MIWRAARVVFDGVMFIGKVNKQASRVPIVGPAKDRLTDAVLDSLFGPAEDIDYVSRTAPSSPPPTR